MGVEHIESIQPGVATPTPAVRVALGLSQVQKAKLKGVHFGFRGVSLSDDREAALSEDLKLLTIGVATRYIDQPSLFAVAYLLNTNLTAVGNVISWFTVELNLWDFEVYQDICWVPGTDPTIFTRMDLFYEKVRIDKLEKASQLYQRKRQFVRA